MRIASKEEEKSIKYLAQLFTEEDEIQSEIRKNMISTGKEGMALSAHEAQFLSFLIQSHKVKKVAEFGCFCGYSAYTMAKAMNGGQLYTTEKMDEFAALANDSFSKYKGPTQIQLLHKDAKDALEELSAQAPFDLVFIDADKSAYPQYLMWAEKNVKTGGLIIGDNTLLFGNVGLDEAELAPRIGKKMWSSMREFNEYLADKSKFISCYLPTSEGMTLAIKK